MDRIFKIDPYVAVGNMKFGDRQDQIRDILGLPSLEEKIGYPVSDHYSDDYEYMSLVYNLDLRLVSVTLTPLLTKDRLFVEYNGMRVNVSVNKDELIPVFKTLFEDLTEDDDGEGFTTETYGVKVYCPEEEVEDVVIYDLHCYDAENEHLKEM